MGRRLLMGKGRHPVVGGGAVLHDADGTCTVSGSVTSYDYTGITVGSGSGRALIAFVWTVNENGQSTSVIWDPTGANQAMTFLGRIAPGGSVPTEIWGLRNPATGNKSLRIAIPGAGDFIIASAVSFTGVNQVSDALAFPPASLNTGSGASPSLSLNITSATGHAVVGAGAGIGGDTSAISMNETTIVTRTGGAFANAANYGAGAGSVTLTVSSPATLIALVGIDIAP